jgi:hypothetical protein
MRGDEATADRLHSGACERPRHCVEERQQSVAACHAQIASDASSGRAQRASAQSLLVSKLPVGLLGGCGMQQLVCNSMFGTRKWRFNLPV